MVGWLVAEHIQTLECLVCCVLTVCERGARCPVCPQERDRAVISLLSLVSTNRIPNTAIDCLPPSRPPSAHPPPRHERRGSKILCQPVQVVVWAKWKHFWINELSFRMSHNSVTEVSEITGVSTLLTPCSTTSIGTTRVPTRIVCYIRILQLIV